MASQDEVESTLRWVADEQHIHACAPYGENHATVSDALSAQRHRVKVVGDYKKNLEPLKDDAKARDLSVHEAYSALEEAASKRLHCLEDIQQISSLEPLFGQLTTEFATKASQLVEAESARAVGNAEKECGEGVAQAAQNCILAVRANWCWISKLVKCADTHLEHVSDYHQFFHTVAEYNEWMPADLKVATSKVMTKETMNADKEEADQLHNDLMEILTMFLHWHGKTEALFDKSRKIIPVHLRAKKLDYFRPVNALCDYKTKDLTVREGEELTLLDNSDSQSWKVKNLNNTEAQVPAVVLVIPGPEPTAVKAAGNLRLQLLGIWTHNVKRIGKSLIWFMILCNKDWNDDEIKKLKAMTQPLKDDLGRCLTFIEETLCPYWADYKGFQELQTRITILRDIIKQEGDEADKDADFSNALVLKFNTVEELLKRYKDLWTHWDTFRMICETCRAPEFLLIVEKWQQLKYMGMDELRSRWHTGFGFSDEDQDEFASWLERWLRTITTTTTVTEEVARSAAPSLECTTTTHSETLPLEQGEQLTASPDSAGVVYEQMVNKSSTTVLESSVPGFEMSGGEEFVDGSGYSRTVTTTTKTTRTMQQGGGQPEMTVTKTEQVYDGTGQDEMTKTIYSGIEQRAREVNMTTTDMLGGEPGFTTTAITTSEGPGDITTTTRDGSVITKTTSTRVMSSSSTSGSSDTTLPGEATVTPQSAATLSQTQTVTKTSSTTPGELLTKGGGESFGSGDVINKTTTTKTTRITTSGGGVGDGFRDGSSGSGYYSETMTTVEGQEGAYPGAEGYLQTSVTTTSRSQVAGAGGYTTVTSQDEGSFGSGSSESGSITTSTSSSSSRQHRAQEITQEVAPMETATSEQVTTSEQEEKRTFVITEGAPEAESVMLEEKEESKTFVITEEQCESTGASEVVVGEREETSNFVITGVIDPATEQEITMQEAVLKGIINSQTGCYCNTITGESWPIPVAMNAGFIKVEFTTTKKTAEKRRDVGLITIKTQRESRPYTVKAVVDAKTERRLTVDEAITAGILDQKNGTYYNALDDMMMSLADAIDSNLLLVEYDRNAEVGEPEIFSKTFAIHSVVDQKAKKTVSFSQAIRKGLLDRETGAYYHNITGDYTYVGDAIKRGFIKATVVKDPNSLDIDPENKLVVEQLQNIRKKLLNPMKAIATLRKAAVAEAAAPDEDNLLIHAEQGNWPEGVSVPQEIITENLQTNVEESNSAMKLSDDIEEIIPLTLESQDSDSFAQGGEAVSELKGLGVIDEHVQEIGEGVLVETNTDHGSVSADTALHKSDDLESAPITVKTVDKLELPDIEKVNTNMTEITSSTHFRGIDEKSHSSINVGESEFSRDGNSGADLGGNTDKVLGNSVVAEMQDDSAESSTETNKMIGAWSALCVRSGKDMPDSSSHAQIAGHLEDTSIHIQVGEDVATLPSNTQVGLVITDSNLTQTELSDSPNYGKDGAASDVYFVDSNESGSPTISKTKGDIGFIEGDECQTSTMTKTKCDIGFVGGVEGASSTITETKEVIGFVNEAESGSSAITHTKEVIGFIDEGEGGSSTITHTKEVIGIVDEDDGGSCTMTHTKGKGVIGFADEDDGGSSTMTHRKEKEVIGFVDEDDGEKSAITKTDGDIVFSDGDECGTYHVTKTKGEIVKISAVTEVNTGDTTEKKDGKRKGRQGKLHTAKGDKYKEIVKKSKTAEASNQKSTVEAIRVANDGNNHPANDNVNHEQSKEMSTKMLITEESAKVIGITDMRGSTEGTGSYTGEIAVGSESDANAYILGIVTTTSTTTTTTTYRLGGEGYNVVSGNVPLSTTSTTSTTMSAAIHAERLAEARMAAVVIDEPLTSTQHGDIMSRICRVALPLQILMLILLGMACVVPMTEEEFSCALANGFDHTLGVCLGYKDGRPPT